MRKNGIVAYGLAVLMVASVLAGCGSTETETVNESEVYMSQFAEYEDGSNLLNNGSSVGTDSALSNVANGEKIFEDTLFDGNPIEVVEDAEEIGEPESEEPTKAPAKAKKKTKKTAAPATDVVAPADVLVADGTTLALTAADGTAVQPEQPVVTQQIDNPTENNSSSDSSGDSSDTGSGITQTCDDDNTAENNPAPSNPEPSNPEPSNQISDNKANASFE